jgi:hypothetical protein
MVKRVHVYESQFKDILNPIPSYDNMLYLYETMEEGEKKTILEGLIKSYPPEKIAKYIENYFNGEVKTRIVNPNDIEMIVANMPNDNNYEEAMIKIMDNLCGYKMAKKGISTSGDEIELIFEPKFQKSVNDEMREHEMLIHVSPSYNREKILKMGFCPKFKNEIFNYNDRIYFYSDRSQPEAVLSLSLSLAYSKDNERNGHIFDFYMIDPRKVDRNIQFHRDGMTSSGVAYWTYDNVPSNCIIDIRRMQCNGQYSEWKLIG